MIAAAATVVRAPWRRVLLLSLAALTLVGCGGPRRPQPAELPPNPALIDVRQGWSAQLGAVDFPLDVRVTGTQVALAGGNGNVVTIDATTGRETTRVNLGTRLSAGVGSDGARLAVVTTRNELVVMESGRELWRRSLGAQAYTAPLVAGGRVFVLSADRAVTAFDGASGNRLWHVSRAGEPLVLRQAGVLTAVGNTLVTGLAGRLAGLDPQDGTTLWEAPIATPRGVNDVERLVDLVAPVARQGDELCVRAFQSAVGCVDAAQGRTRWARPASGGAGVADDDERVYGAESDGTVQAWQRSNGERAWSTELLRWRTLTAPLVLGRSVVVGDNTGLVHLLSRADGRALARLATDGSAIATAPVAAGDTLVVVTRRGAVYGFRPN